jgi:hypothetical protein
MMDDPMVEEARNAGQAYINSFHGDLRAVTADLQRRTEEARRLGHEVVSLPLRPIRPSRQPAAPAGQAG